MRLKFLAKVFPMSLCCLILVATFTRTGHAGAMPCMAVPVHFPGMQTCMPEPDPGIIPYALGFLGVGIVALRSKFRR